MRRSVMVLGFIIISVFIVSVNANAEVVSFGDTSKFWPGWGNGSSDNFNDTIGIPNFTGGEASITSGQLNKLTFDRATGTSPYWGVLSPGDLFIDIGADQTWDYVVDLSRWRSACVSNHDPGPGNYSIYSLSLALNNTSGGYILSGRDNRDGWRGYYIRDSHPVAANIRKVNGTYYDSVYFSGWGDGSTTEYYFDFKGLDLGPSGQFTIGWQPNCANDVIYETLSYHATPEPATMSLLGLGLAGLLRFRRKKRSI